MILPRGAAAAAPYDQGVRLGLVATVFAGILGMIPPDAGRTRAIWVWDAGPLLTQPAARAEFLTFAAEHQIGTAWIQVDAGRGARLNESDRWRELLADARRAGLSVHALDGSPDFVLPSRRDDAMNVVNAVIAFNRASPADARFDGIHFDNEPYLLSGWHEPAIREQLMTGLLDLSAAAQRAVNQAGGLQFGVDIPFWWQTLDAESHEAIGAATFNGQRKAASYHLLDLVDNVGIMDYRNVAGGRDGLIAHATELLTYATKAHARVFVGVETSRNESAAFWFLTGVPRAELRRALKAEALPNRRDIRIVEAGDEVAVGVQILSSAAAEQRLQKLAADLHAVKLNASGRAANDAARRALAEEGEWRDITSLPIVDANGMAYGGLKTTRVMLPKITFAGRSNQEMNRELDAAEQAFRAYPGYAGLAIHHYDSYRARFTTAKPD